MKIKKVDIQTVNYCNRSCEWCYGFLSKRKPIRIPIEYVERVIYNINTYPEYFDDTIEMAFSLYCEPIVDFEYLIQIGNMVKNGVKNKNLILTIHTNGDYLKNEMHKELSTVFCKVHINRYDLDMGETYMYALDAIVDVYGLEYINSDIIEKDIENGIIEIIKDDYRITIASSKQNYIEMRGRGSQIPKYITGKRTGDCGMIGSMMAINQNGIIMPCCDSYSEVEDHFNELSCGHIMDDFTSIIDRMHSIKIDNCSSCDLCSCVYGDIFY